MAHKFVFLINGKLETFTDYESIPNEFDHIIKFLPDIPDGPHTHEEHDEIHVWNERLQELIRRENASSNKNR
jgi:hypothetical protein